MPQPKSVMNTHAPRRQRGLALEPQPEQVLEEAERLRARSSYWRQRYRTLDALLADPVRAHVLLTCARSALRARLRGGD